MFGGGRVIEPKPIPEVRVGKQNVFNYFTTNAQQLSVSLCVYVRVIECTRVCVCNEIACHNKMLLKPAIAEQNKTDFICKTNERRQNERKQSGIETKLE